MSNLYIMPNRNNKQTNGLELQPEKDWFPTPESMEAMFAAQRALGTPDELIVKRMMDMAVDAERWLRDNVG